jgi:hypothetical protein
MIPTIRRKCPLFTGTVVAVCLTASLASYPYVSAAAQRAAVDPDPAQTAPYTLHVTKSEVVVDVIAVDAQNHPVLNLVPADLKVFDEADRSRKTPKAISSFRMVDPSSTSAPLDLPQTDFLGLDHGSCMLTYTVHYQLAYDPGPEGAVPGIHTVQIQSNRRGLKLFYRHGYLMNPPIDAEDPLHKSPIPPPVAMTVKPSEEPVNSTLKAGREETLIALGGNSFGSTVPSGGSLCADVYEIPERTERLPDFRSLSPIGIVYTDFLSVSRETDVIGMGLPNVTTRGEWVGLDYYGRIWITHPGSYNFQMISDDGALLEIDGKRVIDLDGIHAGKTGSGEITLVAGPHTMHIPYFEGPRTAVLMLWVEAPGDKLRVFDTRSFAALPATLR